MGQNPTVAEQARPQDFFKAAISDRIEMPWTLDTTKYPIAPGAKAPQLVQDIFDKKCVQCHNGGAGDPFAGKSYTVTAANPATGVTQSFPAIPYLDLSSRPITVPYDMRVETYPASYVSLFFPATLEMGMGDLTPTGDMPPKWALVNNARESVLIKKLNVKAADGTFAYGTPQMHPEDKGVTLTDEERLHLIRSIDVGGQFYSRKNTGFVPFAGDPLTTAGQKY